MSEAAAGGSASASPGTQGGSQQAQATQGGASSSQASQGKGSQAKAQAAHSPGGQGGSKGPEGSKAPDISSQSTQEALKELGEQDLNAVVKVKVNGQVRTMSVKEALKRAELAEGAHEKFQKASQLEKRVSDWAKAAKENPDLFFKEFGIDPDEYSQARLTKYLADQQKSPEQRRAEEMEKKLKEFEDREKDSQTRAKQEKEAAEFKVADQRLRQEFVAAWKDSGLPDYPSMGVEIAKVLIAAEKQGLDWTPKEAAAKVKEDFLGSVNYVFEQLDADAIHKLLPAAVLKKLREFEVSRVTQSRASQASSQSTRRPGQSPASQGTPKNKMMSETEYKEYFDRLARGE